MGVAEQDSVELRDGGGEFLDHVLVAVAADAGVGGDQDEVGVLRGAELCRAICDGVDRGSKAVGPEILRLLPGGTAGVVMPMMAIFTPATVFTM